MSKLLLDESPQTYQPTLAAWIGLNEAIFLQQLHYILTENDTVGKFADGRKWYRDKPRDFMVKYFPFWDESIVKRTIANLKEDALILARSDLNKDPKDRSLWYTVNYPVLEILAGPVARITDKSAKRKEARKSRRSKSNNSPDYAKVQNVPLSDEAGTNSTLDNQQNVLLPQVQNVPTPKESLPKDSKPKDIADESALLPDTPHSRLFFEKLTTEFEAKGRRPPKKFPSLACKRKFDARADYLNGNTEAAIERALQKGILGVTEITDFIAKYNPGQKETNNYGHYSPSQTDASLNPARERTGPPTTAEQLTAAWERKSRGGRDPT